MSHPQTEHLGQYLKDHPSEKPHGASISNPSSTVTDTIFCKIPTQVDQVIHAYHSVIYVCSIHILYTCKQCFE